MVTKNHVHRFKRSKKDKEVFFCCLPDCFLKIHKEFLAGKDCLCECGHTFKLTHDLLRRAAPKCENCRTDITARSLKAARSLDLSSLFTASEEVEGGQ